MENKKITLRELREGSGKSIAEVAEALGVSHQSVSNYELGVRRISLEQILLLSKYYSVSTREIIEFQLNSCLINQ